MSEHDFAPEQKDIQESDYQDRPDLKPYKKRKPIEKMKTIFRVINEDLTLYFDEWNYKMPDNQGESRQSLNILKRFGYTKGLLQLLNTEKDTGINGDFPDLQRRQKIFGSNVVPLPTITPYGDILAGYFEDPNVNFLIIVTTVYLIISIYAESNSYVECLTIYLGLFFQALIASLCDHSKNKQFLGLKDEINKEKVTVYRGAYGTTESIRTKNLVVGDIIHVQQGDRVPADCILVEEMNITVDQTMYHKDMANCEKSLSVQISPEEHKYQTQNSFKHQLTNRSNQPRESETYGTQKNENMNQDPYAQQMNQDPYEQQASDPYSQPQTDYDQQMPESYPSMNQNNDQQQYYDDNQQYQQNDDQDQNQPNAYQPTNEADPYGQNQQDGNTSRENVNSDQNLSLEGGQAEQRFTLRQTKTFRHEDKVEEVEVDNHKKNPDPFLFTGTMIMSGSGKAVVCAVGKNTRVSRNRSMGDLLIKNEATFLEDKLEESVSQISKYAMIVASLVVLTQFIYMTILLFVTGADSFFAGIGNYAKIIIIGVSILLVSIPEGAPLAASIAMALSTSKLKQDKILIKNLEAVQTCSMLHDICIGKTGTITQGRMSVGSYQFSDMGVEESAENHFITTLEISQEMKDLIAEVIAANTDVRFEVNEKNLTYEPKGQEIEVALVRFLIDNEIPAYDMLKVRNLYARKIINFPYSTKEPVMVVVREVASSPDLVRVYVKGAPELVLPSCERYYNNQFMLEDLNENEKSNILENHIVDMAQRAQKVISFAYKEMSLSDLNQMLEDFQNDLENPEFKSELVQDLIYLVTFGLDDPIRSTVAESIQLIKYGQILEDQSDKVKKGIKNQANVRMVTGDHIQTALTVAHRVGIINQAEKTLDGVALTGEEFRKRIGAYKKFWEPETQMWRIKFASKMKFKAVKDRLRIIARATDEDKLILIQGIKQEGGLVAMSGEKTSDATALKMASVGLCMGSGCTVAKENSDLVIMDNDFRSIHHAIMWGRTIFGNVRKFMQFQLTINITLCLIILLSSVSLGNSPFNVIQLLWINLIMDTLATIAICTEPFEVKNVSEASTARISRKDRIMNAVMWRNILGQSLYQLLAILILMYAGHAMFFDEPFNLITEKMRYDESDPENGIVANDPTNKMVLHTFIFHTFVLMSLFNQVNCRLIYEDDLNIFRTMFNNSWFWLVFIFEMLLQNYMIYMAPTYQLSQAILQVAPITFAQNIVAWSLGVSVLPVGALIKLIPIKYFAWTKALNVEEDLDDNKVLQLHSMFNEKMGTLQTEYMAHLQTMDEDQLSVDSQNEDENAEPGQINGQDDDGTSDEDEEQDLSQTGPGKGPRSSNVNRYSMRLTQMVEKKKKKKN